MIEYSIENLSLWIVFLKYSLDVYNQIYKADYMQLFDKPFQTIKMTC